MDRVIYVDNAATTGISAPVLDAMMPYLTSEYGNPMSIHSVGQRARAAVEEARKQTAQALHADHTEIFFTGSGTEADNWAINGVCELMAKKGKKHIVTSSFEHHAVLHTVQKLEKQGWQVTYLPVTPDGYITVESVAQAIRPDTALVTIMYANNEIGTIQPIPEIGRLCKEKGVLFHTDAVQAVGNIHIDVKDQCIDLLSLSGHKIHAPKGVGALYVRRGLVLKPFIEGGAQERGRRGGTENVASIVGLGKAMELAEANIDRRVPRMTALRDRLIDGLLQIERTRLNGGREPRLCFNANISFEGVEGESILIMLDMKGICASSGSACTSGSLDPSHVLLSIGLPHEIAHGSVRFTLGEDMSEEDVDYIIQTTREIIVRLRAMSPLWERINKQ